VVAFTGKTAPDAGVHDTVTGGVPPSGRGGEYDTTTGRPSGDDVSKLAGQLSENVVWLVGVSLPQAASEETSSRTARWKGPCVRQENCSTDRAQGDARKQLSLTFGSVNDRARLWALLGAATVLNAAGVTWGLPSAMGWAPDEILPTSVLDGARRWFAGGWFDRYPPTHYALLATVYLPFRALGALRAWAPVPPEQELLFLAGRLVSVAMAAGTLWLAYRIGREEYGERAGFFAAVFVALMPPFVYYAKVACVDGPMLFWFAWSMLFYARLRRGAARRDYAGFAVTATLAVCTKDMAYAFYVLPVLALAAVEHVRARSRPAGVSRLGYAVSTFGPPAACAAATFVLCHNLAFNWTGFVEHVRLIVGPASAYYTAFDNTFAGHTAMAVTALEQVPWVLGWPAALAALAGIASERLCGDRARLAWLLLPALSLYVTFIAVVRYHYDRFFLGVGLLLAIVAGQWVAGWLAPGVRLRAWRIAAAALAAVYLVGRAVSIDVLMLTDSRYAAETWLLRHAAPGETVAATGLPEYLPRREVQPWIDLPAATEALDRVRPAFVVLNADYMRRFGPESPRYQFVRRLRTGESGYRLAAQCTSRPRWLPLVWERPFRDGREDLFTNLDKIGPTIEIYEVDKRQ
jgi:hypothetical protein